LVVVPLGGGTGVGPLLGPAVEVSGGGNASTFEPLPGAAAPVGGLGDLASGSPGFDPGSSSAFDPDPAGAAPVFGPEGLFACAQARPETAKPPASAAMKKTRFVTIVSPELRLDNPGPETKVSFPANLHALFERRQE
jgi:hypothetical protein